MGHRSSISGWLGIVELSAEFGIAASTAQKALAHLRDTGEVRTELGLGTFVADSK